jgi:hypothetical protein
MIVKVQLPLGSEMDDPPALIYGEEGLWQMFIAPDKLPYAVRRAVQVNKGKAYFYATVDGNSELDFGAQAPPQDW